MLRPNHSPRFNDTTIGITDATSITRMSVLRNPFLIWTHAAMARGVSRAMFAPHSFVYTNGAVGRGTGYPRNSWTCANRGWTSSYTKELLRSPWGISISTGVRKDTWEKRIPRRPPVTAIIQNAATSIKTLRVGRDSADALYTYRNSTVAEKYTAAREMKMIPRCG